MKSTRASGVEVAKKRVRNKPQARTKMTREDKKERAQVCFNILSFSMVLLLNTCLLSAGRKGEKGVIFKGELRYQREE